MRFELRVTILLVAIFFLSYVISLLLKRKILERNALFYIFTVVSFGVLAIFPDLLDTLAAVAGIDYPPALLFMLGNVILLMITIYQSIQISVLEKHVRELSEISAIQFHEKENSGALKKH